MSHEKGVPQLTSKELDRRGLVMRRALSVFLDGQPHRRSELYPISEDAWASKFLRHLDREGILVGNGKVGSGSRRQMLDAEKLRNLAEAVTGHQIMRIAAQIEEERRTNGSEVRARELPDLPELIPHAEPPPDPQEDVAASLAKNLDGILIVLESQHRRLAKIEEMVEGLGEKLAHGVAEGLAPALGEILQEVRRKGT